MITRHRMSWVLTLTVAALLCAAAATAHAQTRVVFAPAKQIASVQGADVYDAYCAQCHGPTGVGNGPAARAVNPPPADLTLIVVRNGAFDQMHVQNEAANTKCAAHPHMPDWMRVLSSTYGSDTRAFVALHNVARHIETLQR